MLKPFRGDPENAPVTLPGQIIDHQPVIAPMKILDYRRTKPPPNAAWEVLVQWQGLSPDDTSWEDWSQLHQEYHLEDKVLFQGPQSDKEEELAEAKTRVAEHATQVRKVERPKRAVTKPSYLKDFV